MKSYCNNHTIILRRSDKQIDFDQGESYIINKLYNIKLFNGSDEIIGQIFSDKNYNFSAVQKLDLSENQIRVTGAKALSISPHLTKLTSLNLSSNQIRAEGAEALANSPNLNNLTSLNLSRNEIGYAGKEALSKMGNLKTLY